MSVERHEVHVDLDLQAAGRYLSVPFDLHGESAIEVTLAYDRDGAVIDLGCEDPVRFRGWSGGARDRFAITADAATPGYEPGPLPDGAWSVLLGLHQVPADGVDVQVTVTTHRDPRDAGVEEDPTPPPRPTLPRASERALPALDGLTWFAGDFHSHSLHSDGDLSLEQLAAQAATAGLDFLAVTDHNTISHHAHLPRVSEAYDLTLVPGQEMTTHRGHANAFGDIGWIDFRESADRWVEEVRDRGGLMSVNHPIDGDCSWLHPLAELPPAIELWHIGWFRDLTSTAPWAYVRLWRPDSILLGGSDFHHHRHQYLPGTPTTWVAAEDRSPDALLEATKAGRTSISILPGPGSPVLLRLGDELVAIDADGAVLVDFHGRRQTVHGSRQSFGIDTDARAPGRPPAGQAPYRLESAVRDLLAISP